MERTTVRLPSELLDRARKKAAAEGRTLTSLIEEGLRGLVARRPPSRGERRQRAPISSVSGRVSPGVDLTSAARLEDMLDDEAIRQDRPIKLR